MQQDGRELILHWLRDAHAMENQSVQMLENQLPSLAGFSEFHASVERHAVLSREQRNRLAARITELGQAPSAMRQPRLYDGLCGTDDDWRVARQRGPQRGGELCL